jgi:hypothetical protein
MFTIGELRGSENKLGRLFRRLQVARRRPFVNLAWRQVFGPLQCREPE